MTTRVCLRKLIRVTGALLAIGLVAAVSPSRAAEITYEYRRPGALGQLPDSVRLPLPADETELSAAAVERKVRMLARALDLRLDTQRMELARDGTGEVAYLRAGRHLFKVYLPSGMVRYRDLKLHNKSYPEDLESPPLAPERAVDLARKLLARMAEAELVERRELALEAVHISHRKGATDVDPEKGAEPEILDTRVFVPRVLDGVGVSGHGVQFTFSRRGEVTGVNFHWRRLRIDGEHLPLAFSAGEARARFEKELRVPERARVEVKVSDLVYFDPSPRDPVAFLEPAYLFVYRVLTPIEGRDEYDAGKLLHRTLPAADHGRKQIESPRSERLRLIDPLIRTPRPENRKNDEEER